MKWLYGLLFFVVTSTLAFSQNETKSPVNTFPQINIAFSSGSNNFTSYLGFLTEVNLIKNTSVLGGFGIGPWGLKSSVGVRYYNKYPKGIFYGLSFSSCKGRINDTLNLETFRSDSVVTQKVLVDLKKAHTINLELGYSWQLSKVLRFTLDLGYSIPLNVNPYRIKTEGIVLTESGKQSIDYIEPGGFIFGVAFSIGL
jgi:hypothetical protein